MKITTTTMKYTAQRKYEQYGKAYETKRERI